MVKEGMLTYLGQRCDLSLVLDNMTVAAGLCVVSSIHYEMTAPIGLWLNWAHVEIFLSVRELEALFGESPEFMPEI